MSCFEPSAKSVAQQALTQFFHNALVQHQKVRNHPLPDVANSYLADMLARQASFIPKVEQRDRGFFRGLSEYNELNHLKFGSEAAALSYTRLAERLLFMLTYAREHLVYREIFRRDVSVSHLERVAQTAYSRASESVRRPSRGLSFTAENFVETEDVLRSTFYFGLKHKFNHTQGIVALIAMPDELSSQPIKS